MMIQSAPDWTSLIFSKVYTLDITQLIEVGDLIQERVLSSLLLQLWNFMEYRAIIIVL